MGESKFVGLGQISEMELVRRSCKCSDALLGQSCGTRDCNLEVYDMGDRKLYVGGQCPKGNTSYNGKRAPNYVAMYKGMLNSHLSRFTTGLEDTVLGDRVLIPRTLTFLNEMGVFFSSLYHSLGFSVGLSPESDDRIAELGEEASHTGFCYPMKLAHGHARYLADIAQENPLDKLLLVNAISVGEDRNKFCPYVSGSGYVVRESLGLDSDRTLLPVLRFGDSAYPIDKAVHEDLRRVFGKRFSRGEVRRAVEEADYNQRQFIDDVHVRGEEIIGRLRERGEKIFVGIGRGYTLFDDKAGSQVQNLFSENGLHFMPFLFIPDGDYDVDSFVDNMYWYQGRRMVAQNLTAISNPDFYPVRLTNFNCGPDSMINLYEKRAMEDSGELCLFLQTDGHNSNAQFNTRIKAFNEATRGRERSSGLSLSPTVRKPVSYEGRTLGLPSMGDTPDILAAAFRANGLDAVVMPTRNSESREISKKLVDTNTCRPFAFQVGDQLAWLKSLKAQGIDPNESAATFIARTRGPCRFGQYSVMLRALFDDHGFENVPMMSPSSHEDYRNTDLDRRFTRAVDKLAYRGVIANDLLRSTLHRFRPYEVNPGETDAVYGEAHRELMSLVDLGSNLGELRTFLDVKVERFREIPVDDSYRFPLVVMNGEIFVRSHEGANQDSIRLLEDNGLEVLLEPTTSWVDHINSNCLSKAYEQRDWRGVLGSTIKREYMSHVKRKLSAPFKGVLDGRETHDSFTLIRDLERDNIFDSAVEGESGVSIGEGYAFVNNHLNVSGIYHVGPFGCMQETLATSIVQSLIQQRRAEASRRLIPFMDAVFGDLPVNLEPKIALFAENCRLKQRMNE